MKNKQAFTLIELLVVVLIIGILAAVSVPQYRVAVRKADLSRYMALVSAVYEAQQVYYLAHGEYSNKLTNLDISMPITEECTLSTTKDSEDAYYCNSAKMGISDLGTSIMAGSDEIRYVKFLQDRTAHEITFKQGTTYCFAKGDISKKACQAFGGNFLGEATWAYYQL